MKNKLLYFLLLSVMFSSCSRKSYTGLYQDNLTLKNTETKYNLSKNLLKLEVIYTLNEPRIQKNGIDKALETSNTKVTIDDPIKITKLLVPDRSKTFFISGKQLSNAYFINPDNYQNIYSESVSDISVSQENEDHITPSSLTASCKEAKAYNAVIEISDNISKIKTEIDAKYTLDLVSFYKSQFTTVNEDFKPYVKKSKLKYTVIIDPSTIDSTEGNWANIIENKILLTIYPTHIFKDNIELVDIITLETLNVNAFKSPLLENNKSVEGIVYRSPLPEKLTIKINNNELKEESLVLAQFGALETISVKDLKNNSNPDVILFKFKAQDNLITKNDKFSNINETVELLNFNSNETVETSQKRIRKEYEEKLKNIDSLIERLKARKGEF